MTDFKRDGRGRPLITPPDGGKPIAYQRISKLAGVTDDSYNLMLWQQRTTALGMTRDPALRAQVEALINRYRDPLNNPDAKRELKKICAQAHIEGGGEYASKRGTHLHKLTEYTDRSLALPDHTINPDDGTVMETTGRDRQMMWKYEAALNAAEILPIWIEVAVINDHYRSAGTLDRIFQMPDGSVRVADYKTGAHDDQYPTKVACQVRQYATAMKYDPETGERTALHPRIDTERGLLIHQPDRGDGTVTIYDLHLDAAVPVLGAAMQVLAARSIPKKSFIAPFVSHYQGESA